MTADSPDSASSVSALPAGSIVPGSPGASPHRTEQGEQITSTEKNTTIKHLGESDSRVPLDPRQVLLSNLESSHSECKVAPTPERVDTSNLIFPAGHPLVDEKHCTPYPERFEILVDYFGLIYTHQYSGGGDTVLVFKFVDERTTESDFYDKLKAFTKAGEEEGLEFNSRIEYLDIFNKTGSSVPYFFFTMIGDHHNVAAGKQAILFEQRPKFCIKAMTSEVYDVPQAEIESLQKLWRGVMGYRDVSWMDTLNGIQLDDAYCFTIDQNKYPGFGIEICVTQRWDEPLKAEEVRKAFLPKATAMIHRSRGELHRVFYFDPINMQYGIVASKSIYKGKEPLTLINLDVDGEQNAYAWLEVDIHDTSAESEEEIDIPLNHYAPGDLWEQLMKIHGVNFDAGFRIKVAELHMMFQKVKGQIGTRDHAGVAAMGPITEADFRRAVAKEEAHQQAVVAAQAAAPPRHPQKRTVPERDASRQAANPEGATGAKPNQQKDSCLTPFSYSDDFDLEETYDTDAAHIASFYVRKRPEE